MRGRARRPLRAEGLTFSREPPLTHGQVAVHQVVSILFIIRITETELVAHLVFDGRQQIDVTRGRA